MTDQERKAMEMALEALRVMKAGQHAEEKAYMDKAIEALRQALAQPEQQWGDSEISKPEVVEAQKRANNAVRALVDACDEHVAKVVFPQPEQEPVAFEDWLKNQHGDPEEIGFLQALRVAYYAGADSHPAPPSKPWVSLTDEDFDNIYKRHDTYDSFARAIEAKLKEKNNG